MTYDSAIMSKTEHQIKSLEKHRQTSIGVVDWYVIEAIDHALGLLQAKFALTKTKSSVVRTDDLVPEFIYL